MTVTGLDFNNCMDTDSLLLIERPVPSLLVYLDRKHICAGDAVVINASGANTFSWSTGASSPVVTVTPQSNTVYTVTGFAGGCSSFSTVAVSVINCVGLSEAGAAQPLLVFPNPGNGLYSIVHENGMPLNLRVYDALGKLVYQELITGENNKTVQVDLREQSKGMYVFVISKADGTGASVKVIKD